MATIEDIKIKIDQLDGGSFQNLCDAYLSCIGYKNILSLGMKSGTQKTTIGNPDTYFITSSGQYVFVMYTTQQNDFKKKALEDIDKCLNPDVTGVQTNDIAEIIICHTFGRLSAGDDKFLKDYCGDRNVSLALKGLDTIATDLYHYHHKLAQDYLGVALDTGQILDVESFTRAHDKNRLSAPLDTKFIVREKEYQESIQLLDSNDILVIAGSAGVGKTRFALKLCTDFSSQNGNKLYCIKSNQLDTYEDLRDFIRRPGHYVVLIDDANELTRLGPVLDYLCAKDDGFEVKIIITVRNYALQTIMREVDQYRSKLVHLSTFSDNDIRKLLEVVYGIKNHTYSNRIISIAEGNARLAMLAGRLCIETNDLESIRDASGLYDLYYSRQIESILSGSKTCLVTVGILAFLKAIHFSLLDHHPEILTTAGISKVQFREDIEFLQSLELVDIYREEAVKISDQTFANFLLKYVYVDQKRLSLRSMLEICFPLHETHTIESIYTLLNVFMQPELHDYVGTEITNVWDDLTHDKLRFEPFFKAFHMIRPTETLIELKSRIDESESYSFDVTKIDFEKEKNNVRINDEIINILGNYNFHNQSTESLELLLLYYQKRPDLFMQFYFVLTYYYGIDQHSRGNEYVVQIEVVHRLIQIVDKEQSTANVMLFLKIAEYLLQFHFNATKSGRRATLVFYDVQLLYSSKVKEFRGIIWVKLYELYETGLHRDLIEEILMNYGRTFSESVDYSIIKADFIYLSNFFKMLLSPENLVHCILAEQINMILNRAEISSRDTLLEFLNTPHYIVYYTLTKDFRDGKNINSTRPEELRKTLISEMVSKFTFDDADLLIRICKESENFIPSSNLFMLSQGMQIAFDALSNKRAVFIHTIRSYINSGTPCHINPSQIVQKLFEISKPEEVYEIINSSNYPAKNIWQWEFYSNLPEEYITSEYVESLYDFFSKPSLEVISSSFRHLIVLDKYQKYDKDVWIRASNIILQEYEVSPFIFHIYYDLLFNSHYISADEVISRFNENISLLIDLYLKCIAYQRGHTDFDGTFLFHLFAQRPEIINEYVDTVIAYQNGIYNFDDSAVRLLPIWHHEDYIEIMDSLASNLLIKHSGKNKGIISLLRILLSDARDDIVRKNQFEWIEHFIKLHYQDANYMGVVFESISDLSVNLRRKAVIQFVEMNPDPIIFKQLPLESSHWGGSGSMIPLMHERLDYLESLLPVFTGIKFLQHKQRIEQLIHLWKERIKREEIREVLYG